MRRSCAICRNENIVVSILIYFWYFSFFCLRRVCGSRHRRDVDMVKILDPLSRVKIEYLLAGTFLSRAMYLEIYGTILKSNERFLLSIARQLMTQHRHSKNLFRSLESSWVTHTRNTFLDPEKFITCHANWLKISCKLLNLPPCMRATKFSSVKGQKQWKSITFIFGIDWDLAGSFLSDNLMQTV